MAEKRPAQEDSFGTSQLVKRQKSNVDLGNENAVAVVNDSTKNGALIQSVCFLVGDREGGRGNRMDSTVLAEVEKVDCFVLIN